MTDLNTLIPATSPLYIYLAATIDDVGVIVGYAYDQTANSSPAFVAIPTWTGLGASTVRSEAAPKVPLPEAVRAQIQQNMKKRAARRIGQQQ
jgi:F0F1-type ATP synthase assembly protein I